MSDSSPPNSAGSYTNDDLLRKKGISPKGLKAEKAEQVAWYYSREEMNAWRQQQEQPRPSPALLEQPQGQRSIRDFFQP